MEHSRIERLNRLFDSIGESERLCCFLEFGNLPSSRASDAAKLNLGRLP